MKSSQFSFKEMRMRSQPKISSCCLCVWCKSKELGDRWSTRFSIPLVESFSADFSSSYRNLLNRVAFRNLLNINDGALLQKYVECLRMIGLMVVMLMVFYVCGKLVLQGVGPILRNEYRI